MLIESMIFKKKYIALIFDDNKNITNQQNAYKNYLHFVKIVCLNSDLTGLIIEQIPQDEFNYYAFCAKTINKQQQWKNLLLFPCEWCCRRDSGILSNILTNIYTCMPTTSYIEDMVI